MILCFFFLNVEFTLTDLKWTRSHSSLLSTNTPFASVLCWPFSLSFDPPHHPNSLFTLFHSHLLLDLQPEAPALTKQYRPVWGRGIVTARLPYPFLHAAGTLKGQFTQNTEKMNLQRFLISAKTSSYTPIQWKWKTIIFGKTWHLKSSLLKTMSQFWIISTGDFFL